MLYEVITARLYNENKGSFAAATVEAMETWKATLTDTLASAKASEAAIAALEKDSSAVAKEILSYKDWMPKRSNWIFGGDGWAYDIGYGGLDHVLATGKNA